MKKHNYLGLGVLFLLCTAVWVKITKARLYADTPSKLSMFASSDNNNDINY